jgi:Mn-dependent DtxR family transcriptional regulator
MTEIEEKVMAFLEASPNSSFNFSEISRAVNKAPPTIKRVVERLQKLNKVSVIDKKSMKLVRVCK